MARSPLRLSDGSSWLQIHMTFDEANEYLRNCAVGTFVIRRSQSSPSSYGIAVVQEKQQQRHIWHGLIDTSAAGWSMIVFDAGYLYTGL